MDSILCIVSHRPFCARCVSSTSSVAVVIGPEQVGVWFGFYIFVALLIVLQILHLFWFYTIVCMVWAFAATGGVEKDVREETDSEPEETTGQERKVKNVLEAAASDDDNEAKQDAAAAEKASDVRQRAAKQPASGKKSSGKK
jgi:hypothetical protein